jgi:hypothetical protein
MTPEQRQLIKAFVENEPMFNAVRDVLLQGMLGDKFASENWVFGIDEKLADDAYGNQVKTTTKALQWLNRGLNDMKRIASSNPQPAPINEAR